MHSSDRGTLNHSNLTLILQAFNMIKLLDQIITHVSADLRKSLTDRQIRKSLFHLTLKIIWDPRFTPPGNILLNEEEAAEIARKKGMAKG
jgi:hypothetical protein